MNEEELSAIGRPGGYDDEPTFEPSVPPVEPNDETGETNESDSLGRSGGYDDEPVSAIPSATIEARPVVSLPALSHERDMDSGGNDDEKRGVSWLTCAAWFVFWGVVLWLGLQLFDVFNLTLALPFVLRVPALVAELAALSVAIVWIVRVAGFFVGFRKREERDLCAYYRKLSKSADFVRQFPKKDRPAAATAARELSRITDNFKQEWEQKRQAFEERREEVARGIVREHAALTAVKTASSPWKIVDVLSVFYNNTRMIERIARLYRQPCGGPQAFRLVCQWTLNLYVAGQVGDVMKKGADAMSAKVAEALENSGGGLSWLGSVVPFAGKLFAKAGEGAVNYYLCRRLGLRAIEAFKPSATNVPRRRKRERSTIWAFAVASLLAMWFVVMGIVALVHH